MGVVTEAIKSGFANSFTSKGRATRSEFWLFSIFLLIMSYLIMAAWAGAFSIAELLNRETNGFENSMYKDGYIEGVFTVIAVELAILMLCCFIPSFICVLIRRLHDIGKSTKNILWLLVPVIGWILLVYYMVLPSDIEGAKTSKGQDDSCYINNSTQQIPSHPIPTNHIAPPPVPAASNFVLINNQQVGPLYLQDIKRMLQDGQINCQTLIWKPGMSDWDVINNIQELNY